ncbi:enoyl-ACP reductase FabI [Streptomyces sp. MUM 203J]|uniref:enoyl-ACP reductase FabI n=1 Tax=Streptomyces sp. MUM 203J TaxID=2791990 RepID=UPI001F04AA60|nr:enoyl-ACP reductase FabI [Streptomyces sp. MUM 203J]MCH0540963.1 enoyl-ACP reductase FabI [Streptomyces sp. MUM 203J]
MLSPHERTDTAPRGGLLAGKRVLVTGVVTDASIAFHAARIAQQEGAEVVLTGFGRLSLVERIAARLPKPAPVVELDVTDRDHLEALAPRVREHVDGLDGVVHSIAYGPEGVFRFLGAGWDEVSQAVHVSAYSLKSLTAACLPLFGPGGGAVAGLTFDATVAWPHYDWMGVAKAALESTNRYLARDLGGRGIRCNLVAAGPVRSMAAKAIPGFPELAAVWAGRAPAGWDPADPDPAARGVVALLSDFFPRTTGEIVHVDGGVHMTGA